MSEYILSIISTDTEGYIEINNNEGEIIKLTPQSLTYDSPLIDGTLDYTKKIAYGVAENNEYVELNQFDKTPKIHVSPNKLPLFSKEYEGSNQLITSTISEESSQGFRVHNFLDAESYTREYNLSPNVFASTGNTTSSSSTTRVVLETNNNCKGFGAKFSFDFDGDWGTFGYASVSFYADREIDGSWGDTTTIYSYSTGERDDYNLNFLNTNLTPGKYRIRVNVSVTSIDGKVSASANIYRVTELYGSQTEILSGDVNWLAIESS